MCEYKFRNGEKCEEEAYRNSKYCILHIDFPDEHSKEFNEIAKGKEEKVKEKIQRKDFNFEGSKLLKLDLSEIDVDGNVIINDSNVKNIYFGDQYISGNIEAENSEIEEISFENTTVLGDIDLDNARIGNIKISSGVRGDVLLRNCNIRKISFDHSTVEGDILFNGAKVDTVLFRDTTIRGDAVFEKEKEKEKFRTKKASFETVTIKGDCLFTQAKAEKVSFNDVLVAGDLGFESAEVEELNLNDVTIVSDISFKNAILTHLSFNRVSIRGKCSLEDIKEIKTSVVYKDSIASVLELGDPEDQKTKILLDKIKDLESEENMYRNAKVSYEKLGEKEVSDQYFYREMRTRRKQKNLTARFFEWLIADLTCEYGINWKKPIMLWGILVFIVFPAIYFFPILFNIQIVSGIQMSINDFWSFLYSILNCLYFSIITATTLGYGDLHPVGIGKAIASVEAVFGIGMWTVFLVVFSRKFMR
ncbi:two pore domain potassium channel family protein [Methanophagales archaeon]|nr:MAG: two pore domain potassium channel family protein [Methanophagales archaeon]